MFGLLGEFAVHALGRAPQHVEGVACGQPLAFQQDAFGLADDVAAAEGSVGWACMPGAVPQIMDAY